MAGKKRKRGRRTTTSHVDAFAAGGIAALHHQGYTQRQIADSGAVWKSDNSPIPYSTVGKILRRMEANPHWRGERKEGSGRTRSTTPAEDDAIVQYVKRRRGEEKLTSTKVKRCLDLSSVSLVQRRLREVGVRWLRRRCKVLVPSDAVSDRLAWASRVKRSADVYLRRWVYTDGCSFYLDKDRPAAESSARAALGKFVWRMEDGSDSLYEACVGPSAYKKSQGECVRVWGLLIGGCLHISILERGAVMNRWEYEWIIQHRFSKWLARETWPVLVQDGERCLWCDEPLKALRQLGVDVIDWHPPYSPDLNAIENAWAHLRARLDETHPGGDVVESRSAFISRLRAAVVWVNRNCKSTLASLARNQKERADAVENNDGHRTGY